MKIPLKYTIRNFRNRRLTTGLTVAGVALVVFVFSAVLMIALGLEKTLVATGSDGNIIALRVSASAEITSIIGKDQAGIMMSLPQVARTAEGKPLASGEVVVVINLPYTNDEGYGNLTVRGVAPEAFQIRPQIRITEGRMFQWGAREIIVGKSTVKRYKGVSIGSQVKFGGDQWTIVGVFNTEGSGFDSEFWGDVNQIEQAFQRPVYSTVTIKLDRPESYNDFVAAFGKDIRLNEFEAKREKQFYEEQSETMSTFIRILGIVITVIFSLGAMIGAMITMYAAVSNRTVEIGTLRALGFRRRSVLAAFLVESVFLSFIGGVAGLVLASFLQFFSVSMMNFASFSELAFGFSLSPSIIVTSLAFSIIMGLVGGFLPAVRASRLSILEALRSA
jgi:ABC-type antimicrobial peptide transport system permease subunit